MRTVVKHPMFFQMHQPHGYYWYYWMTQVCQNYLQYS
uniref:Uncharacterized protein n=1 Tax=Rhizophora mucronata TaxID=61149 RepID=A0A2P2NEG3_RHIMU